MKKAESHRLGYKQVGPKSYSFFSAYLSRGDTTRYLPLGRPYSEQEVDDYIRRRIAHWENHGFGLHQLFLKMNDECIGYCGLEKVDESSFVDLRFGLVMKHWGKGFAKEAAWACLDLGFSDLGLAEIFGVAVPENLASIAVMLKVGMVERPGVSFYPGDLKYYSIRRDGWEKLRDHVG